MLCRVLSRPEAPSHVNPFVYPTFLHGAENAGGPVADLDHLFPTFVHGVGVLFALSVLNADIEASAETETVNQEITDLQMEQKDIAATMADLKAVRSRRRFKFKCLSPLTIAR